MGPLIVLPTAPNPYGSGASSGFGSVSARVPATGTKEDKLSTAVIIIILALLLGGVGLAVEALRWLLIIALVLLVIGAFTGRRTVA